MQSNLSFAHKSPFQARNWSLLMQPILQMLVASCKFASIEYVHHTINLNRKSSSTPGDDDISQMLYWFGRGATSITIATRITSRLSQYSKCFKIIAKKRGKIKFYRQSSVSQKKHVPVSRFSLGFSKTSWRNIIFLCHSAFLWRLMTLVMTSYEGLMTHCSLQM